MSDIACLKRRGLWWQIMLKKGVLLIRDFIKTVIWRQKVPKAWIKLLKKQNKTKKKQQQQQTNKKQTNKNKI